MPKYTVKELIGMFLKSVVRTIETLGRLQAEKESHPVENFTGVFSRLVAGFTKSDDQGSQKLYGVILQDVGVYDKVERSIGDNTGDNVSFADRLVESPSEKRIYFAGQIGITTLKALHALVDSVIAFQMSMIPDLTLAQAITWFIDRFNHAFNIQQRSNFRLNLSYSTGVKPLNDMTRQAVTGDNPIPVEVLETKYRELIETLKKEAIEEAEKTA